VPFLFLMQTDLFGRDEELLVDLFRAYFNARRNKRNTRNALAYEVNFEQGLLALYE
jgi:RNA-directed DNA polymerase